MTLLSAGQFVYNPPSMSDAADNPTPPPSLPAFARIAAATSLGVALLLLAAGYLSAVSVLQQVRPALLEKILRCPPDEAYRHPVFVILCIAICLNLLLATILRIPLRLRSVGAWLSHLGVLVLAGGAGYYGLTAQNGQCGSDWIEGGGWSEITDFLPVQGHRYLEAVKLPEPIYIEKAIYETYPGSVMPKDYICKLVIGRGNSTRRETLSLNHPVAVGPYQISQGSWRPQGSPQPQQIIFSVASRPGIGIVWLGMALTVLGMLWAYYVKPLLRRARA